MADMGVYLAFDVDYISMIPTGGELVACRHSVKVNDEDLAGAYELIRKLYQEVRIERDNLKRANAKLRDVESENASLKGAAQGLGELCDRYKVENAKLREERDTYRDLVGYMVHPDIPDQLAAENTKLRELVAKYSAAAKYLCGHSHCNECNLDCASVFDDVPSGWDCARMLLDKRARELGVEV